MESEAMDRILAAEEELIPSSGFAAAVMERVRDEAAMPEPIPFPWKRALPGMVLAAGVLGWGGYAMGRAALAAMRGISWAAATASMGMHLGAMPAAALVAVGWTAAALAVSFLAWLVSRRLAGGR